jgi:hypothetical protein
MPHFENVTQIKADYPVATAIGGQYGVNHAKKIACRAGPFTLPESRTEREAAVLNEFVQTTGYSRKYTPRIFNRRETKEVRLHSKDGRVKLKPVKKKAVQPQRQENLYR